MMEPPYPPARAVAARVHPHFERHLLGAPKDVVLATLPDVVTMEAIVNAGFWASLQREEGYPPRISLALVSPEEVRLPLRFERPIPLYPRTLTRMAPAVERPGIHLGISRINGSLHVWGATRKLPGYCFVLEVVAPGLLVIKHSRGEESGKFVNMAVLQGDEIKVVDQRAATMPDCPNLLTSLLGFDTHPTPGDSMNILIELAVSMRAHARGGSLLVVPSGASDWLESMLRPITYSVQPAYAALGELVQDGPGDKPKHRWQDALRRTVDGIAGLTAVDGATVITDRYHLLAFGAKIIRRQARPPVSRVFVTEPIEGVAPSVVDPAQLGGTRHLSAAQFTQDQRDSIALVASQDGRFTVFAWSQCEDAVHAHRIETLLL